MTTEEGQSPKSEIHPSRRQFKQFKPKEKQEIL